MPELPEVETVVRSLSEPLRGRTLSKVKVLHSPSVEGSPKSPNSVSGHKIERMFRRGKFIRIDLNGGLGMAVHLRMTGWLGIRPAYVKDPKFDPYLRLRFFLDDGSECLDFQDIRTFGRVWCGKSAEIDALHALSKLGPEPLEIDADAFAQRLRSRGGRLKALLLNQEFLAGVGNIYADEALFAARLHPLASASRVKPESARRLHGAIQRILSAAIDAGGSSVENFRRPDGEKGWFQRELLIYGREGEACSSCGTAVKRIVMGQRGTWFCPACQKKS